MAVNGTLRFDVEAKIAQVEERVTNISSRLTSLDQASARGFADTASQIASLASEFRAGQKTQWPSIWAAAGVVVTVIGVAVWQTISPIQASVTDLKNDFKISQSETNKAITELVVSLPKNYLSTDVAEILRSRSAEDRQNMLAMITDLREKKLATEDWKLRNDTVDRLVLDLKSRIERIETKETK